MASKEISVSIRAKDYASRVVERVKSTFSTIKDKTISVNAATKGAQAAVESVKRTIDSVKDKNVKVTAATQSAETNVRRVKKEVQELGAASAGAQSGTSSLSSGLSMLGTKAMAAATARVSVTAIISAAKSAFIEYNTELEQTRTAFTSMLGSANEANTLLSDLQKFAAETPFEMPGVRTAAQQLLAFGYDVKEVIPTLTALGNAASGLGKGQEGFNQLAFVFGQIRTTGKLMGQDVMQLAQAGVPVKEILAKNLGLTKDQLAEIGAQGIDANIAIQALIDGMNERFPQMMEKQSQTFEGVLSNIKDNLGQAFGGFGMGIFAEAKGALLEIKNITDQMLANVQGGKNIFAGLLPEDYLQKIRTAWEDIKSIFAEFKPLASALFEGGISSGKMFVDMLRMISPLLKGIARAFTFVAAAATKALAIVYEAIDTVLEVALEVERFWSEAADVIADSFAELWEWIKSTAKSVCDAVLSFVHWLVDGVVSAVPSIADAFGSAFDDVAAFARSCMETVASLIDWVIGKIREGLMWLRRFEIARAAEDAGARAYKHIADFVGIGNTPQYSNAPGAEDEDFFKHLAEYKSSSPPPASSGRSGGVAGKTSAGRSGASKAAPEAKRLTEKVKQLTEKVQQDVAGLTRDIAGEIGTVYEKAMSALEQKIEGMQKDINEAATLGIDTGALTVKMNEYAAIIKEKAVKAWREANEDIKSDTALLWAQINGNVREEAESTYEIGVRKIERERENKLKEIAMTKDSAEARVEIERWAAAQIAQLEKARAEAMRKSPLTVQDAWKATLEDQYEKLKDTGAQMKDFTDSLYSSLADGFTNSFQGVLTHGFKGIQEAFSNMLKNILSAIAKFLVNHMVTRWLSMMTGGGTSGKTSALVGSASTVAGELAAGGITKGFGIGFGIGKRATGGPVSMGRAYLVGERGPEIFRPNQPGRILNSLPPGSSQPSIRVIINNNTNERMTARTETKFNGSEYITNVVIDAIATNKNGMRDALKGAV